MSTQREKMIELMTVKRLTAVTQKSYLYSVECFVKYYETSLDQLAQCYLQRYIIYLATEKNLTANTCRLQLQGIKKISVNLGLRNR